MCLMNVECDRIVESYLFLATVRGKGIIVIVKVRGPGAEHEGCGGVVRRPGLLATP